MGNEQSVAEGGDTYGFRVLGIQENSPSCDAGFVSFFDFIISANDIRLVGRGLTVRMADNNVHSVVGSTRFDIFRIDCSK